MQRSTHNTKQRSATTGLSYQGFSVKGTFWLSWQITQPTNARWKSESCTILTLIRLKNWKTRIQINMQQLLNGLWTRNGNLSTPWQEEKTECVSPRPIATYTIDNISMPTPPGIMDTLSWKMFEFVMKTIQSLWGILAWFVCNSDHQNVQETEVCGHTL